MTDLQWASVRPRKHRHDWVPAHEAMLSAGSYDPERTFSNGYRCRICRKPKDDATSRRGKNNRSRGNAIERAVAKELGLRRVGQFGGPEDVGTAADPFIVQVKSGKSFPERLYRWLKALPSNASQTPLLVIADAPGPGKKRRALVVLTLEDWVSLHGTLEAK